MKLDLVRLGKRLLEGFGHIRRVDLVDVIFVRAAELGKNPVAEKGINEIDEYAGQDERQHQSFVLKEA